MMSEKTPAGQDEALAKQIESIEEELATMKLVMRRAGRTRLLLLLAFVVFVGVSLVMFKNLFMSFGSEENLTALTEGAQQMGEKKLEDIKREVGHLQKTAWPEVQEIFKAQVEKDQPKIRALIEQEGTTLRTNLEVQLRTKIQAHYDQASVKYQKILQEEFPELNDPELMDEMLASLTGIVDSLVDEYFNDQIRAQFDEMGATWQNFEVAEITDTEEHALEKKFVAAMFLVAAMKLDEETIPQP